jgi:hypothetical protein
MPHIGPQAPLARFLARLAYSARFGIPNRSPRSEEARGGGAHAAPSRRVSARGTQNAVDAQSSGSFAARRAVPDGEERFSPPPGFKYSSLQPSQTARKQYEGHEQKGRWRGDPQASRRRRQTP